MVLLVYNIMKKERKIFCITKNKYFYFIKILRCNKGNDVYKSQEVPINPLVNGVLIATLKEKIS